VKGESDIKKKLDQVRFRHLKRTVRTSLSRRPENCAYNRKLGDGSTPDMPAIGVCMYKGNHPDGVCDEAFGGRHRAAGCPYFEAPAAEDVRGDFDEFLAQADAGEIAYHFPDMAALLWVLDEAPAPDTLIPDGDDIPRETPPVEPGKPGYMDHTELACRDPWYVAFLRKISGR
jgi:hypothetical protein